MSIRMLGIDHNKASIEEREVFSFTKKMAADVLLQLKAIEGIQGCIILSTCNRMELWVSCREEFNSSIYELLCSMKAVDSNLYKHCFIERSEYDAIEHLFYLTCGLKSKIIGEDQILTQVKEALELSRDNYCTDNVLETLFRIAVTSAKIIKTQVPLSVVNSSIIHRVIYELKSSNYDFQGKRCMVIGNGAMGKLAATKLKEEGADVTVTVRQYRSGIVEIPNGCNRIHYGERFDHMVEYDMVISATASPNLTIQYEHLCQMVFKRPVLFIDLAVPRDIDPQISENKQITLYDIDHFKVELQSNQMKVQLSRIDEILQTKIEEFICWYTCRDMIPILQAVSECAAHDVGQRIGKTIKKVEMDTEEKKLLAETIHTATNKVVSKLMFGLRDNMSNAAFQECMEALKNIY